MKIQFSENSRVQVPAAIHLLRLGYKYLSRIPADEYDHDTNILSEVFKRSFLRLNPEKTELEADMKLQELLQACRAEDLGRDFYKKITATGGAKIIDFDDPDRNEWHCTTEFTCRNDQSLDEFRPDVTCFVNGLPLAFIEVKIPNNREGIMAERNRIERRMANRKFRTFFTATQLMIFSNNQEYDHEAVTPIQGAFYATPSAGRCFFNVFREQDEDLLQHCGYSPELVTKEQEEEVLIHRHYHPKDNDPDYQTNLRPDSPTNRLITSLLSKERFLYLLRYGIAHLQYTKQEDEQSEPQEILEKHIMRYPQLFAAKAITRRLDDIYSGDPRFADHPNGGIIWHTQGSGKTALSYYSLRVLKDYFARRGWIAKFYFIVDRLDLMEQATDEFHKRGLKVYNAQSRKELMDDIDSPDICRGANGEDDIMVVNIHKFCEDKARVKIPKAYSTNLRRVFFIDEAHRGYNPQGSFLANLLEADKDAVRIALTGTPLLKEERESWKVFGSYIDTYYYDKSIKDGYTLRLTREDIEVEYKEQLTAMMQQLMEETKVKKSEWDKNEILTAETLLTPIIDYVQRDLHRFRIQQAERTLAGMIVCESNPQARVMFDLMKRRVASGDEKALRPCLILHDEDDKETRKTNVETFKKTDRYDVLIVNAMLLTGFDAARLKKLYLMRKLKDHTLLQALTRVNRPYRDMKMGYIVDFANIKENFIEINNLYLQELAKVNAGTDQQENTESSARSILITGDEVRERIEVIKDALWTLPLESPERFSQTIDEVQNREDLIALRTVLEDARALSNQIRSFGDEEMRQRFDALKLDALPALLKVVNHRIDRLALLQNDEHKAEVTKILREALSQLELKVTKVGEHELEMTYNMLITKYKEVEHEFNINIDKQHREYVSLADKFHEFFRVHGFTPKDVAEARRHIGYMGTIMEQIHVINLQNARLKRIYGDDERYVRIHKRIVDLNRERADRRPPERPLISDKEREVAEGMSAIKAKLDEKVWKNENILANAEYFGQTVTSDVALKLYELTHGAAPQDVQFIRNQLVNQYLNNIA